MKLNISMMDHFKRMMAYDQWANNLLLGDIEALVVPDVIALEKMSHILLAQEIWLARLLGEDLSHFNTTWLKFSISECRVKLSELGKKWNGYLEGLPADEFGKMILYTNTKGKAYQLLVEVILTHVFDHSTYHRGQIATAVKKAGGEPHSPGFSAYILENSKFE